MSYKNTIIEETKEELNTKETSIERIVEILKVNNAAGRKVALLIGAGVSVSAGIPLASGIIKIIKEMYPENCKRCKEGSYEDHMKELSIDERKKLINNLIEKSKLNAAHLYMASLIKAGYISRILTLNFDTLLTKALALENIFPGVYDVPSIANNFELGLASDISIFHLHGQNEGMVLVNTNKECEKNIKIKEIIKDTIENFTLIVVGYSGKSDPELQYLIEAKNFRKRLFWICYKDEDPCDNLMKNTFKIDMENAASYLKGYDADSFFIKLARELKVEEPRIIKKPFSYLEEVAENIAENKIENIDPMLETKKWIVASKQIFEEEKDYKDVFQKLKIEQDKLIKLIKESLINGKYENYEELRKLVNNDSPKEAKNLFAKFLYNFGIEKSNIAKSMTKAEKEKLLNESIDKYKEAIELKPDYHEAYIGIGIVYDKREDYDEAIEWYKKAIDISPDYYLSYYNIGVVYGKKGDYEKTIEYYEKAIDRNVDYYNAYTNLAYMLIIKSESKTLKEKEALLDEAISKSEQAIKINPIRDIAYTCFGMSLMRKAKLKEGDEKFDLLNKAIKQFKQVIKIKPDYYHAYNNMGATYGELKNYGEAIKCYKNAIEIKEDYVDAYENLIEALIITDKNEEAMEWVEKAMGLKKDNKGDAIIKWLRCVVELMENVDGSNSENEFNKSLEKEFELTWSFEEIRDWMDRNGIDEEKRERIEGWIEKLEKKIIEN